MNKNSLPRLSTPPVLRRHSLAAAAGLLLGSALLTACGGGGGGTPVTTASTGSGATVTVTGFSAGIVSGKGSTIVNGVRFDDSGTSAALSILGDDDSTNDAGGNALAGENVKVGMEVEIEHGVVTCPTAGLTVATCDVTPTAVAARISFGNNSLLAPISNFKAGNTAITPATPATPTTFDLLGQKVTTSADTAVVLGDPATPLAAGVVVEVHGVLDTTTGITTATRIEVKPAYTGAWRLRGVLNLAASTIGGTAVTLTAAQETALRDAAADGKVVGARLAVNPAATPPYAVAFVKPTQRPLDDSRFSGLPATLDGAVSNVDSISVPGELHFKVRGESARLVTTGLAQSVVDTITSAAASGTRLAVAGTVGVGGVLNVDAQQVAKVLPAATTGEFHGRIVKPNPVANTAPAFVNTYDAKTRTFQIWVSNLVNGVLVTTLRETIEITSNTVFTANKGAEFSEATLASLGPGGLVIVFGNRSADGTRIVATKVKRDVSLE